MTVTLPPSQHADEELAKRVLNFLKDSRSDFGVLAIRVDSGVVSVSGTVPTFHLRQLAISFAKRVAGVRRVVDEVEVAHADIGTPIEDPVLAASPNSRSLNRR